MEEKEMENGEEIIKISKIQDQVYLSKGPTNTCYECCKIILNLIILY